jgi:hypothetical protein
VCWTACFLAAFLLCRITAGAEPDKGLFANLNMEWGGYLRAIGNVSWLEDDTIYQFVGHDPYYDGQLEWRLKNTLNMGSRWSLETHYELVALGGDFYEDTRKLAQTLPIAVSDLLVPAQVIEDDYRFFDLGRVLTEKDRYLVYNRLDRLNLTYNTDWGTVRLGRQALTWGNGLIFNPMDLFDPFAPTAVQRDYKVGEDMAFAQIPVGQDGLQMLYIPRRDPQTGNLDDTNSAYAAKYHLVLSDLEMDIMAARNFDDPVAGLGASGYWGGAAWRIDALYTDLTNSADRSGFFQVVANMDYAWTWGGKNVYGLVEFYYNGLGRTGDYAKALTEQALVERLSRGEMFTLGRYYLAGQLQVELHPLVQSQTTAIVNLSDPSGLLQPQFTWSVTENVQAILGAQWHWGRRGSEFGGYPVTVDGIAITAAPADRVYLWLTYYY